MRSGVVGAFLVVLVASGLGVSYLIGVNYLRTTPEAMGERSTSHPAVQILSVRLVNNTVGSFLRVNVTLKNTGDVPIWYYWPNGVTYTVSPLNLVQPVPDRCPCSLSGIPKEVSQGQTSSVLSSLSGIYLNRFVQAGMVQVDVAVSWYVTSDNSTHSYVTNASQDFTIYGVG